MNHPAQHKPHLFSLWFHAQIFLGILLASLVFPCLSNATNHGAIGIPGVHGGVVTTTEPAAAHVGMTILKKGGNAIDAAAAVAFALNVVEPQASGIGGGGFMMIYLAEPQKTIVIDSRETAPGRADPEMFLDNTGTPFPFPLRSTSGIAVGVPGMVRGIALALETWGTLSLPTILAPSIDLASNGIVVNQRLAEEIRAGIQGGRLANEPGLSWYDQAREVFAPGGNPPKPGAVLLQPALANTLELLAQRGPQIFYNGKIAEAIVATQRQARTVTNPSDQKNLQGRMTLHDLAEYESLIRQPVKATYRTSRILSAPPPSSGGLTVLHILKLLERFPIGDRAKGFGFGSHNTLHVMAEAMRLAFADRAVWMGDADVVPVPIHGLLSLEYVGSRSALIHPERRLEEVAAGNPLPFDHPSGPHSVSIQNPLASTDEGRHTTHFTIVDHAGNIVTYTNTIESRWGTGLMVPGFGFLLNNQLTDFNAAPAMNTDPRQFNPGANDVAPGKRPRSSLAPTIVWDQDQPVAAYGSPGGSTIINSVVNITLNLLDHKMSIQEAIDAPRLSQTSANGLLRVEELFSHEVKRSLKILGHRLNNTDLNVIGAVQAVVIDPSTGQQFGAADRRRGGSVLSLKRDALSDKRFPADKN